ncbi:CHASE2 domain-containing protein [Pseudoxanthomonas suwonensis]|uniref:CHASE2 domain-containing protein n=1 Tax=Pseudoxanthomonas suwonensis TaxID=314722 RepID=A0A0E3Z2D5_9GAMM|nr:CHASE2 domain-containing protein [Pseudoxanthomonas suwonensis]AKC87707.1 hypothetical protein WQ53_14040 [Pseudoxanthomonas suwonensis]
MNAASAMPGKRRCALALAAGVLAALLGGLGLAGPLDDVLHRWLAPSTSLPAPVAVLVVDDADPWPWPNGRIADLLERLRDAGVRGVALDLPLQSGAATDPEGDARLARTLLENRVALGVTLVPGADGPPDAQMPPIEFAGAARLGHVLLPRDRDGRVRQHLPHVVAADGVRWPSLPLALAQPGNPGGSGRWETAERWRIGYDDRTAPPTLRAVDLLAGRLGASRLHGHWVLVGLADASSQPPLPGPSGTAPLFAVEHEARALVAMLRGSTPRPLPAAAQALLALLLAGIPVLLGLGRGGRGWHAPAALLGGFAAALALSGWLLGRQLWFAPGGTVAVLLAALAGWGVLALRRQLRRRQRMPGLASRRRLDAALYAARAAGTPHSLLLVEVGASPAGDHEQVRADVSRLAQLMRARARRPGDVAAHLGAGRFALLLPDTPAAAAEHILEDIRQQAAERDVSLPLQGRVHGCSGQACDCAGELRPLAAAPGGAQPPR